jgi:hypothetical protein
MKQLTIWVLLEKFCQLTGLSKDAVKAKRCKGVWPDGFVTKKAPDGNLYVNIIQYEQWVEQGYIND